jgi:chromosome segregation ATPase
MYQEALRSQINSLRHQLDLSKKVHDSELKSIKDDFDRKVDLTLKEKSCSLSLQKEKINELQKSLHEEKQRTLNLRKELFDLEKLCNEELNSALSKRKVLEDDVRFLNEEAKSHKTQVRILQSELSAVEKEHEQSVLLIQGKFDQSYSALTGQNLGNQGKIVALNREILILKEKLKHQEVHNESDIRTLEEALRSTYNTIELQTFSIEKLRKAVEELLKEKVAYSKQQSNLEQQEKLMKEENKGLKELIEKLERKIYGRSNRGN